ncbi:Flagellar P-ring protein [Andreprevotia sp. IGB-42]|uniref:flagellar basal body P-ring protein FlgI n=1 Tax=Andreprevotia sp. IGB-42 TaxID=2497473 RepID=UPI0013589A7A|nr:flagellar basal body P-ring protein FlgI [Andreprevotia sp. IGB-42]KAF0813400.1 Flagellar P-ring protein [Andreprevotia sp. IGB-42]
MTMKFRAFLLVCLSCASLSAFAVTDGVRIKDLGRLSGWRENPLVGYGLVTGLAGTGDSAGNKTTRQSISNMLKQFGVNLPPEDVLSRNTAAVIVKASLPAYAQPGDTIDVTVTSLGDARSLVGGSLLLAPLKGPNDRVYVLAQGDLAVGGYSYDMNGSVVQKNHPTVGTIPGGGVVEVGVGVKVVNERQKLTFVLADPDFTTASRIAAAINQSMGRTVAAPRDAAAVEIDAPAEGGARLVDFVARLERLTVHPDNRARVVINERTGTVVSGGDVQISKVSISHGEMKVSIVTDNSVSQPTFVSDTGRGVRTEVVSNSRIDVAESDNRQIDSTGNTVADLVQSLTRIKTNTRDIISILRAVKAAGALHADLVVQ